MNKKERRITRRYLSFWDSAVPLGSEKIRLDKVENYVQFDN
jgi:hypothetical protein